MNVDAEEVRLAFAGGIKAVAESTSGRRKTKVVIM